MTMVVRFTSQVDLLDARRSFVVPVSQEDDRVLVIDIVEILVRVIRVIDDKCTPKPINILRG
jgi:hypothetical protein